MFLQLPAKSTPLLLQLLLLSPFWSMSSSLPKVEYKGTLPFWFSWTLLLYFRQDTLNIIGESPPPPASIDAQLAQPIAYEWACNSVCFFSTDTEIHARVENNPIRVCEINSGYYFGARIRIGVGPFFLNGDYPKQKMSLGLLAAILSPRGETLSSWEWS